ncbi:MAG: D-alanyl-D-alanine carboxypeptidase [Thermodesulfobacteriota bacterium]|nr:D-alanyl-D-alanine carboxypeptidase [Thermodesulfobacteriota bacterium]
MTSRHTPKIINLSVLFLWFCFCTASASGHEAGVLLSTDKGEILYAENQDGLFIPASTLKLVTSLGALYYLGEDFSFKTEFFLDKNSNLFIKGYGDPLLTSEVIKDAVVTLAGILKKNQSRCIENIILDDSYFQTSISIPGNTGSKNPYDALNGALSANFNTIAFRYSQEKGKFISAEKQTPLLDIFQEKIKKKGIKRGRIPLSKKESRLYPGQLVKHFLEQEAITINGRIQNKVVPAKAKQVYTLVSPYTLRDIIQNLLKYSNNFMANQILLTTGAALFSPPASLEKGVKALTLYLKQKTKLTRTIIAEGSGLSRKNQTTPSELLEILMHFKPYYSLMEKRNRAYVKTGTLYKVCTRAGYFLDHKNTLYPFVIMVNGNNRGCEHIKADLFKMILETR